MHKLRVMTIVGTRPEIIRLSRIVPLLDEYCKHTLVHTGQNYDYELNEIFFNDLGVRKPDVFLEAAGESAASTISEIIKTSDTAMKIHAPEAILILGDTNSALSAIAAKRRKIPIFHMEAGNRCFDFRVPEEINRKIVDHISDINLPYSNIARDYLLKEGLPADRIIKTGSPMREVLDFYAPNVKKSQILKKLKLTEREYFLVSVHREENVDSSENLKNIFSILDALAQKYQLPVIVSTHPRTRKKIEALSLKAGSLVKFLRPFGFHDYIKLQISAYCVLSDSGTITEEASILNFPALNLREVHERPEGFEEASVMLVGLKLDRILQGIEIVKTQPRGNQRLLHMASDYKVNNVSAKILRIIQSYTDFVNREVWRKPDA